MKKYDLHIHNVYGKTDPEQFCSGLREAGMEGAALLSAYPFPIHGREVRPPEERLKDVLGVTAGRDGLYPFFFLDPTEPDAPDQVEMALAAGIAGFKIICNHFYPSDQRALPVYERIAKSGKPLLFHSGILYDGINASGKYNRPVEFECLLPIKGLRFALAHISWPWTDECIAVYGKFNDYLLRNAHQRGECATMFIDLTPGTPAVYRREALEKLILTGFEIGDNLLWGTDAEAHSFNPADSLRLQQQDEGILEALVGTPGLEKMYGHNFQRFLGI